MPTETEKGTYGPGELVVSQCLWCRHRPEGQVYAVEACSAFLGGIPPEVRLNRVDHRKPVDGDGGIRWEPKDGLDEGSARVLAHYFDSREIADGRDQLRRGQGP